MSSDNILKPFSLGFQRKLEMCPQADNKFSVNIYYFTPEGHRLANKTEVTDYLNQKNVTSLKPEDFSFAGHPIHKEPYEVQSWNRSSAPEPNPTSAGDTQMGGQVGSGVSDNNEVVLELKTDPDADASGNNSVDIKLVDIKPRTAGMRPYIVVKPESDGEATADQLAMMSAYSRAPKAEVKTEVPAPVGFIESPDRGAAITHPSSHTPASPVKTGSKRPMDNADSFSDKTTSAQSKKAKTQVESSLPATRSSGRRAAIEGRAKIKRLSGGVEEIDVNDDSDRDENYAGSVVGSDSEGTAGTGGTDAEDSSDGSDFVPASSRARRRSSRQRATSLKQLSPTVKLKQLSPKDMRQWMRGGQHNSSKSLDFPSKTNGMGKSAVSEAVAKKNDKESQNIMKNLTNQNDSNKERNSGQNNNSSPSGGSDCKMASRTEILTLGKKEVKLNLPISILPSLNTCDKPEMRSLYAGDPAGMDWVKVLGKVKDDNFMYQCMFCVEARREPKLISSHQLSSHKQLLDTMGNIKPGRSQMFIFCRHCDYIAMQKSAMWHHMQTEHKVCEILLPEADPDTFEIDKRSLGYIDQKKVFYCPQNKCCYKTHYNPEIISHMLGKHRSTEHVSSGYVHIKKAKLPPNADQQDDAYMCNMCQFVTFQSFLMQVHCMEAHAKKFMLYSCLFCEEQFIGNSISRVERHLQEKHNDSKVKVTVTVIESSGQEDQGLIDSRNPEGETSTSKPKSKAPTKSASSKSKKS